MRHTTKLILLILMSWAGCHQSPVQNNTISHSEYVVYSAIVNELFNEYETIVVHDSSIQKSRIGNLKYRTKAGEWVESTDWERIAYMWPELDLTEFRSSYEQQNSTKSVFDAKLFKAVREIQILRFQDTLKGIDEDVQQQKVIISFSRVAFANEGTRALVYLEYYCGHLCAAGNWVLLSRQDTTWTVVKRLQTWVS